jgi:hypothetical protein
MGMGMGKGKWKGAGKRESATGASRYPRSKLASPEPRAFDAPRPSSHWLFILRIEALCGWQLVAPQASSQLPYECAPCFTSKVSLGLVAPAPRIRGHWHTSIAFDICCESPSSARSSTWARTLKPAIRIGTQRRLSLSLSLSLSLCLPPPRSSRQRQ